MENKNLEGKVDSAGVLKDQKSLYINKAEEKVYHAKSCTAATDGPSKYVMFLAVPSPYLCPFKKIPLLVPICLS